MTDESAETRFHGVGVSPGIARGNIQVMRDELEEIDRYSIAPSQVSAEIARFESALVQTRIQILEMQQKIAEAIGTKDAGIFDAHLLVVEDRTLIDEVLRKLECDHFNVEAIFHDVAAKYAETLGQIDDPYLRERALDIQDVMRRVVRNLQGKAPKMMPLPGEAHILVAHNLTPRTQPRWIGTGSSASQPISAAALPTLRSWPARLPSPPPSAYTMSRKTLRAGRWGY